MRRKNNLLSEEGFTLTEVLCALLIMGILIPVAMNLLTEQWRLNKRLKDQTEAHYAVMVAGRTIIDAIRMSEETKWQDDSKTLEVKLKGNTKIKYEIRTTNGLTNLYRIRNGGHNPIVSGLQDWSVKKDEQGLWTIIITAKVGSETIQWKSSVHQRI